jgi:hypothetical protein
MCVLILSTTFVWNILILRSKERDCIGLYVKYPLFLSDFSGLRGFSTDFPKILKYKISAPLFHADRRTDMTKLTVAFRNFANNA